MLVISKSAIAAGDATLASIVSEQFEVENHFRLSLQTIAVGTLVGVIQIQYSNEINNPQNWENVPNGSIAVSGAGVSGLTSGYLDISYKWIQIIWTKTSATAGATITANLKTCGF